MPYSPEHYTPEQIREKRRENDARYRRSAKGKQTNRKYRARIRQRIRDWKKTPTARAQQRRRRKTIANDPGRSERLKMQQLAYSRSEKGKRKKLEWKRANGTKPRARLSPDEKKERRQKALNRYNRSEKGRATRAQFFASAKGKAYLRSQTYLLRARVQTQNRRARLKAIGGVVHRYEWLAVKAAFQNHCAYCGAESRITMDHVVPIAAGGEHTWKNIVPACRRCNAVKHARSYRAALGQLGLSVEQFETRWAKAFWELEQVLP